MKKSSDYSKQCWYCGSKEMTDHGAFYKCANCGATWNMTPQPYKYTFGDRWQSEDGNWHYYAHNVLASHADDAE